MSDLGKRVIFVGPVDSPNTKPLNVEGLAITAILPGTVVESVAAGLRINATAATIFGQEFLVADKDQQRTKSVDDAWTIAESMVAIKPRSGEFVNVLVATGQTITERGKPMSLNGAGLLKIAVIPTTVDATSEQVLAFSDEIITTTATTFVRVRVA